MELKKKKTFNRRNEEQFGIVKLQRIEFWKCKVWDLENFTAWKGGLGDSVAHCGGVIAGLAAKEGKGSWWRVWQGDGEEGG